MDNNRSPLALGDSLPSGEVPQFPYGLFLGAKSINAAGTSPNEIVPSSLPSLDALGEEERRRDEIENYRLYAAVDNTKEQQTTSVSGFNIPSYISMQRGEGVDPSISTSTLETIGEQEVNRMTSAGSGIRGMFKETNDDYNRLLVDTANSSPNMYSFDATKSYDWATENLGGSFGQWTNSVGELIGWVSTDKVDMDSFNIEAKLGAEAKGWDSDVAYQATVKFLASNPDVSQYFSDTGVDPHEFTRLTKNPFAWTFQMNQAVIASQANKRMLTYEENTGWFGDKADKLYYGVKDPTMIRDLAVTTLASFGLATLETGLAKFAALGGVQALGAKAAVDATSKGIGKYLVRGLSGGPLTGPIESLTYNALKQVVPSIGRNGFSTAGARAFSIATDAAIQGSIYAAHAQKDAYNFEHLMLNFGEYQPEFKYDTDQIFQAGYEGGAMGLMFFGGMRLSLGLLGDISVVRKAPAGKKFGAFASNLANSLDGFSSTPEGRTIFGNKLGGNRGILFGDLLDKGMRGIDNRNTAGVLVNGRQLYHYEGFSPAVVSKANFNEGKAREVVSLWSKITNTVEVPDSLIDPDLLAKSDLTYDVVIENLKTLYEAQSEGVAKWKAAGAKGLFTIHRPYDNFRGRLSSQADMDANTEVLKTDLQTKSAELTQLETDRQAQLGSRPTTNNTNLSQRAYKQAKKTLEDSIAALNKQIEDNKIQNEARRVERTFTRSALEDSISETRDGLSVAELKRQDDIRSEIVALETERDSPSKAKTKKGKAKEIADNKRNRVARKVKLEALRKELSESGDRRFERMNQPISESREERIISLEETANKLSNEQDVPIALEVTDALAFAERQLTRLKLEHLEDGTYQARATKLNQEVLDTRSKITDKGNLVVLALGNHARRLEELQNTLSTTDVSFTTQSLNRALDRNTTEQARAKTNAAKATLKAQAKVLKKVLREGVGNLNDAEKEILKKAVKKDITRIMRDSFFGYQTRRQLEEQITSITELMGGPEGVKEARRAKIIEDTMNNNLGFGSANTAAVIHHIMNTTGVLAEAERSGISLSDVEAKFAELTGRSINYGSPLEVYHAKAIINYFVGGNNADILVNVLTEIQKIDGFESENGAILGADRVKRIIREIFKTVDRRKKDQGENQSTVFYVSDRDFRQSRNIQLSNSHIVRVEIDPDGNVKVEAQKGSLEFKDGKVSPVYPAFREAADFTEENVIDIGTFKAKWDAYSKAIDTILSQKDKERVVLLTTTLDVLADETKAMLLDAEIASVANIAGARAAIKNLSNTDLLETTKEIRELVTAQLAEAKAAKKGDDYRAKHKDLLANLFTLEGFKDILVERAGLEQDPTIKAALQNEIKLLESSDLSVGEGIRSYHEKPVKVLKKKKKKGKTAKPDSKEDLAEDLANIDFGEGKVEDLSGIDFGEGKATEAKPIKPVLFTTSGKPMLEPTPTNLKLVFGFSDEESVVGAIIMKSLGVRVNRLGNASIKLVGEFVSEGDSELARIFIRRSQKGVSSIIAANKSGDLFTVAHEMGHYARYMFLDHMASAEERAKIGITETMYDNIMKWLGASKDADGRYNLTVAQEERFANGMGIYIRKLLMGDGKAANTGIQFAFNKIGEHLGSLKDSFKSAERTEGTKNLTLSPESEMVYAALLTAGAEANITDIFHMGFKDALASMSEDERHVFGQRILGEMKWEAYKAKIQIETAAAATVTSKVVDAVVTGNSIPTTTVTKAAASADVSAAKVKIAKTPSQLVNAISDQAVSDAAVTRLQVMAAINTVVANNLNKTVDGVIAEATEAELDSSLSVIEDLIKTLGNVSEKKPRTRRVAKVAEDTQKASEAVVTEAAVKISDSFKKQDEAGEQVIEAVKLIAPEQVVEVVAAIKKRTLPNLSFLGDTKSTTLDEPLALYKKLILKNSFLSKAIKPSDADAIVEFSKLQKTDAYRLLEKNNESKPNSDIGENLKLIVGKIKEEVGSQYIDDVVLSPALAKEIQDTATRLGFKESTFRMMIKATFALETALTDHLENNFARQLNTIRKRIADNKPITTEQRELLAKVTTISDAAEEAKELSFAIENPMQKRWADIIINQYHDLLRNSYNEDALQELYLLLITRDSFVDRLVAEYGANYSDPDFLMAAFALVPAKRDDFIHNFLKASLSNLKLDESRKGIGQRTTKQKVVKVVDGVETEVIEDVVTKFNKEGSSTVMGSSGKEIDILDRQVSPLNMSIPSAKAAIKSGRIFASLFQYIKENGDEGILNFVSAKINAIQEGNNTNYKIYIKKLFDLQQIRRADGTEYSKEAIKTLELKSEELIKEWVDAVAIVEPEIAVVIREILPEIKKKTKSSKDPVVTETFAQSVRASSEGSKTLAKVLSELSESDILQQTRDSFSMLPRENQVLTGLLYALKTSIGDRNPNASKIIDIFSSASKDLKDKSKVVFEDNIRDSIDPIGNVTYLSTRTTLPIILHEVGHAVTIQLITAELSRVLKIERGLLTLADFPTYIGYLERSLTTKKLNPHVAGIVEAYLEYLDHAGTRKFLSGKPIDILDYLDIKMRRTFVENEGGLRVTGSGRYSDGMNRYEDENSFTPLTKMSKVFSEDFMNPDVTLSYVTVPDYLIDSYRFAENEIEFTEGRKSVVKYLQAQLSYMGYKDNEYVIMQRVDPIVKSIEFREGEMEIYFKGLNKSREEFIFDDDSPTLKYDGWFTLYLEPVSTIRAIRGKLGPVYRAPLTTTYSGKLADGTPGLAWRSLADTALAIGLPYGMGSVYEFISQAFSDKEHARILANIESKSKPGTNLLSNLYIAVRGIFGLDQDLEGFSLLQKVLSGVEGITTDPRNKIVMDTAMDYLGVQTESFAQSVRKPKANKAILKSNEFRQNLKTNKGRWYTLARKLQQATNVAGVDNEEVAGIKVEMENLLASMSVQRKGLKSLGLSEDFTSEDLASADRLLKGLEAIDPTSLKLGVENANRIILNDILEIQDPEIKMEYIKAFRSLITVKPELKHFLKALEKSSTEITWLSKTADDLAVEGEEGEVPDPTTLRKMGNDQRRSFLVNTFFPTILEKLGNKAGPQNILSKFFQAVPGGDFIARKFQGMSGGSISYNDTANSPYIGLAFLAKYFDPNIDVRDGEITGSYDMPSLERAEAEAKLILTSSGIPEIRTKIVASKLTTEQLNALNSLAWKNLTKPEEVPLDSPHRDLVVGLITARNKFNAGVAEYLRKHGSGAKLENSELYGTSHRPSGYAYNNPEEFVKALTKHELKKFQVSNEFNGATLDALGWIEITRAKDDGGVDMVIVREDSPVSSLFKEDQITKTGDKKDKKISWGQAKKRLIKADEEGMALLSEDIINRYHDALANVTDDYLQSWRDLYKNFSNPTAIFVSMRTAKDRILRVPGGESDNKSLLPMTYFANKASDYTEERLFTHDELVDNEELSKFYSDNILGLTIEETNTRLFQHVVTKDITDMFGVRMTMDDVLETIKYAEKNYVRDIDVMDVKATDSFHRGFDKLRRSWLHKTHRLSGETSDYDKNFRFILDNSHGIMMGLGGMSAGVKTIASEIPRALLASDRNKAMITQFIPNLLTAFKYGIGVNAAERRLNILKMGSAIHWTRAVLEDTFTSTFETAASRNDYAGPVFGRQGWWRNLFDRWDSMVEQNKTEKRFSDKAKNVSATAGWLSGGILRWSNEMVNVISIHNALKNFGENAENFNNLSKHLEKYRDRIDGSPPARKELNRLAKLCGISQDEALDLSRSGLLKRENISILHKALTLHKEDTTTEGLPDSTRLLRWAETLGEEEQPLAKEAIFKFAGYIKTLARNTNTEPTLLDTRVTLDPVARMLRLYTQFGTSNSVQAVGRVRRSGNVAMARFVGGQLLMQLSGGLLLSYLMNALDEEETMEEIEKAPVAFFLANVARMPVYGAYSWVFKALLVAAYGTYAHVNNQTVPKSVGKADIPDLISSPFQYRFDSVTKDVEKLPGLFMRYMEGGSMSPYERKQAIDSIPFMDNILLSGLLKKMSDPDEIKPVRLPQNLSRESLMPSKAPRMPVEKPVGLPSPMVAPELGTAPRAIQPPRATFPKVRLEENPMGGVSKELADALELL